MFKVGDKVCDPVYGWNGYVYAIKSGDNYPIFVLFENDESFAYTSIGSASAKESTQRLFHGHMVPGTGLITFTLKKEPVYEWQWLIKKEDGSFTVSAYREYTDDHVKGDICSDGSVWHSRIEESKREVKS